MKYGQFSNFCKIMTNILNFRIHTILIWMPGIRYLSTSFVSMLIIILYIIINSISR